jgi:hypothetical protein
MTHHPTHVITAKWAPLLYRAILSFSPLVVAAAIVGTTAGSGDELLCGGAEAGRYPLFAYYALLLLVEMLVVGMELSTAIAIRRVRDLAFKLLSRKTYSSSSGLASRVGSARTEHHLAQSSHRSHQPQWQSHGDVSPAHLRQTVSSGVSSNAFLVSSRPRGTPSSRQAHKSPCGYSSRDDWRAPGPSSRMLRRQASAMHVSRSMRHEQTATSVPRSVRVQASSVRWRDQHPEGLELRDMTVHQAGR